MSDTGSNSDAVDKFLDAFDTMVSDAVHLAVENATEDIVDEVRGELEIDKAFELISKLTDRVGNLESGPRDLAGMDDRVQRLESKLENVDDLDEHVVSLEQTLRVHLVNYNRLLGPGMHTGRPSIDELHARLGQLERALTPLLKFLDALRNG